MLYLDFAKAFDKVPHQRLLFKLKAFGIQGELFHWIEEFLSHRVQRVVVDGEFSEWAPVTSGVPQGSILGPFLFLIYINDLPDYIDNSKMLLFADDSKMYRCISSPSDQISLQHDIDQVLRWTRDWEMELNVDKCKLLVLGQTNVHFFLDGHKILESSGESDLGVMMHPSLRFALHIKCMIQKARRAMCLIFQKFANRNEDFLLLVWKTCLRSLLEYASVVWNPISLKCSMDIERLQRRFTRLVYRVRNLPYPDRLRALSLETLHGRRLFADLVMTYKIIRGHTSLNANDFFKTNSRISRGHCWKLVKPIARKLCARQFLCSRVVNDWNALPPLVVEAQSVQTFRRLLREHLSLTGRL